MKYLWMTIAGFIVGALAGTAVVLVNPLTSSGDGRLTGFDSRLDFTFPGDVSIVTHGGRAPFEREPFDVEPLWETTIRSTSLAMLTLHDDAGQPYAVATRAVSPSKRTELLTAGFLADDHWLISVPAQGAFFVAGESNLSSVVRDTFGRVTLLRREWAGPREYFPTAGPGVGSTAMVIGATGRFSGVTGRAVERWQIDGFSRADGVAGLSGELHLSFIAPETPLDAPELSGAMTDAVLTAD